MKMGRFFLLLSSVITMILPGCNSGGSGGQEIGEWTDENFPPHIRRLTHFGERADWSHDGQRVLFVEKTFGDVFEIDLTTGIIRPMTHHYFHEGYLRALYLSNGDILLTGSRTFSLDNPLDARLRTAELWVLSKALDRPAVPLGEFIFEGPAVSRRNLRIAWTVTHDNLPDLVPAGVSQFYQADVDYLDGVPRLINKKLLLDSRDLPFAASLETQNFVPPQEKELTFTAGGFQGTEVMGLNLETGAVINYSQAPDEYDEPEGIFPDGRHTLVECDQHSRKGSNNIDLYRLTLDGSGRLERLTFFNDGGKFKASNPVVSDDGRFIAFQVPRVELAAGVGLGIYLLDLQAGGLQ
jgi:hypothetical protein